MGFLLLALAFFGVCAAAIAKGGGAKPEKLQPGETPSFAELERFLIDVEGKKFEPYPDIAGHLSVGVGHKILPSEMAYLNRKLTEGEIRDLLYEDIEKHRPALAGLPPLSKGQYIALLSFAFNFGVPAAKSSTLWKRIKAGDPKAHEELPLWIHAFDPELQKKVPNDGLKNRRAKEVKMYLS